MTSSPRYRPGDVVLVLPTWEEGVVLRAFNPALFEGAQFYEIVHEPAADQSTAPAGMTLYSSGIAHETQLVRPEDRPAEMPSEPATGTHLQRAETEAETETGESEARHDDGESA
jgi:hypothetical protein